MKRLRLLLSAFTVLMVVVLACAPNKKMLRDDDGVDSHLEFLISGLKIPR
jgi:hypothetical protein